MRQPEAELQQTIIQGLRYGLPSGWICAHVPNGGNRSITEARRLKRMGVVAGLPDIVVMGCRHFDDASRPLERPVPLTCYFEVKVGSGRLTAEQHDIHDRLKGLGYQVAVVRSWDETAAYAREWGLPLRVS